MVIKDKSMIIVKSLFVIYYRLEILRSSLYQENIVLKNKYLSELVCVTKH